MSDIYNSKDSQFPNFVEPDNTNVAIIIFTIKIIKTFRYHSSPGLALNGLAYKYPSSWRIRFFHADPKNTANVKESLWLPTIKRCVLTKVGVNHFNSDTPTYHDNLAPVDIELSLEFQEAEFVTKESILKETQPVW